MELKVKRILLIDDSTPNYKESDWGNIHIHSNGTDFCNSLDKDLASMVDFFVRIDEIITKINDTDVQILFNKDDYEIVLFHSSYVSPLLNESQLASFRSLINYIVTFSGGSDPNYEKNKTSRNILFSSLKRCLEAYKIMKVFPKRVLFDSNINRFYPLIDKMQQILEDGGKDALINSQEFATYISILGYNPNEVRKYFEKTHTETDIAEKIEEWRLNYNI